MLTEKEALLLTKMTSKRDTRSSMYFTKLTAHFEDGFRLSDLKAIINGFLYFQFNLKLII